MSAPVRRCCSWPPRVAAIAIASSPLAHWRSTETPATVTGRPARSAAVREHFAARTTAVDELDGLTLDLEGGSWINVRASNTEPLLRLNVEAPDAVTMAALRDEALGVIRA